MTDETAELCRFSAQLTYDSIPPEVIARTKVLLLDTIAIIVRARWDNEANSTAPHIAGLRLAGLDSGKAHVFGDAHGYPPFGAAMLNGSLAHSLDFDDTHARAGLHPSAPVIAAAFAAGEISGADMRDVLAGIVVGYEVMCRVSLALGPTAHSDRGFHLSATCGVFGAAAAAGRVMGLTGPQIEAAFGTALSQTAGTGQFLINGAWTKRFQVGAAGGNGVLAACLAAEGYTGATQALEGKSGFFNLYGVNSEPALTVAGLGVEWETLNIGIKPYPCCRAIHAPLDAALQLRSEHTFEVSEIERVSVGMPRKCVDITGEPIDRKKDPQSIIDGQFSAPFCVAAALEQGGFGWDDYSRQLENPAVRKLIQTFDVFIDAEAEAGYPQRFGGSVAISLRDGRRLHAYVRTPLGEPETMLSLEQLRGKVRGLVLPILGEAGEAALFEMVTNAERHNLAEIINASIAR